MNSSSELPLSSRVVWSGSLRGIVTEVVPPGADSATFPGDGPRAKPGVVIDLPREQGVVGRLWVDADQVMPEVTTKALELRVDGQEGHLEAVLSPGQRATLALADAFLQLLDDHQAVNYLEMSITAHGSDGRQVLVTCVRRPDGLTPHGKAEQLAARIRQMEALLVSHKIPLP
jgi:hypothetical protein